MTSPEPLTYLELQAWQSIKRSVYVNSQIAELIMRIDQRFRKAWSDRNKPKENDP